MKKQLSWVLLSLLVIVSILAAACSSSEEATTAPEPTEKPAEVATEAPTEEPVPTPEPEIAEPRILTVNIGYDVESADPAFMSTGAATGFAVFSGLVSLTPPSFDSQNDLAEWIEQSEDGLEISFKLKEGVMWHMGWGEVTAEDVKFSYERMIDEELGGWYPDDWATLDHVEVTGKYEGTIILSEPYAPLWNSTLPLTSGRVLPKKYIEEIGHEEFGANPIGSGPYIFVEWDATERKVVLERNPDYFGDAPYYDEIRLLNISDTGAAEAALETGEIDLTAIDLVSVDRFEADPDFEVVTMPVPEFRWIGMNVENPKLQDINVRLAIRYAIDVPSILQVAYDGLVERETTMIPPSMLGHWEDAPVFDRDVDLAKEYMAKAGLESLDLRMDYDSSDSAYAAVAEVAQANLAEIGINLEINPMDSGAFWEAGMADTAKDMELFVVNYWLEPDPAWGPMWFVCDQIDIWNWMRWCNEEYDELYHQSIVSQDPAERAELYIEMEKIWNDAAHSIWLTHGLAAWAYKRDIVPAFTDNAWYLVAHFSAVD